MRLCLLVSVSAFSLSGVVARKTRITWVNGIAHNLDHMEEGKNVISNYFAGKPILFCYNPTAMSHEEDVRGYLSDLTQAGQQKLGVITSEVDSLVQHLKESVAAVGKNGRVVHIAHSQGALITSLASQQLSMAEMEQMEVIAFGGAAAIRKTPQTPFKRCINYYSVNDPLLMVVPSAAQALRSGLVVGDGDDEFCFLAPRIGDPIQDHALWGPTYGQALQWEGDRFQRMYVSQFYQVRRFLATLLLMMARIFSHRIGLLLDTILRPILLICYLIYKGTIKLALQVQFILVHKVLRPILLFFALLNQMWTGRNKYQPVSSVLVENPTSSE